MTKNEYKEFEKAAIQGTMPDAINPIFCLNAAPVKILRQIANGEIDCAALAKIILEQY